MSCWRKSLNDRQTIFTPRMSISANRIGRFCDGLIEASWIASLIIAPLFFNLLSFRIFEPDKIAILRSLAFLILSAWIIKHLVQSEVRGLAPKPGQSNLRPVLKIDHLINRLVDFLKFPLVGPVFCLVFVLFLTTLFSLVPATSLWGSYLRSQGTLTTFSYLVIFASLVGNLRRWAQVERLITVIILASFPLSVYGIVQHFGLDPILWEMDVRIRIAANQGNSIFLAATLMMVVPLAAARLLEVFRRCPQPGIGKKRQLFLAFLYTTIIIVQLTAIYLSGSRGPVLGLLAAVFVMALLLGMWWRKRWLVYALFCSVFIFLGILWLGNRQKTVLAGQPADHPLRRFIALLDPGSSTAIGRAYIWQGAASIFLPHPALIFPDGEPDRWNLIRPLVGYGPESMSAAYSPFYNPALATVEDRSATPDRAHNETWDLLITGGILGLAASYYLFSSIFYFAFKWMGLLRLDPFEPLTSRKKIFWFFYALGGLLGGLVFSLWKGIEFLGIGIPGGILLGLVGYLLLTAFQLPRLSQDIPRPPLETGRFVIIAVLFAAILGHFIEFNFGIAVSSTRTYFWAYSALLLLVGMVLPRTGDPPDPASADRDQITGRGEQWIETVFRSGIVVILLSTLGYDFLVNSQGVQQPFAQIWLALTRTTSGDFSLGVLLIIIFTWLMASILFTLEAGPGAGQSLRISPSDNPIISPTLLSFTMISITSLLVSVVYFFWLALQSSNLARQSPTSLTDLLTLVGKYPALFTNFVIFLGSVLFGLAFIRSLSKPPGVDVYLRRKSLGVLIASSLILLTLGIWLIQTNLRGIRADIVFKIAGSFDKPDSYPVAIELYRFANRIAPTEDYYDLYLSKVFLNYAITLPDQAERERLFSSAVKDLQTARDLNPLNPDHTSNLARLYSLWAVGSQNLTGSEQKIAQSDDYYAKAVRLSPNNVRLWNEWAYLAFRLQNQPDLARQRLDRALQVDPSYDWTYAQLGDLTAWQAEQAAGTERKTALFEQAVNYYRRSQALSGERGVKYNVNLALGDVFKRLNRPTEAIAEFENALMIQPSPKNSWKIQETLARLYQQVGDLEMALKFGWASFAGAGQFASVEDQTRIQVLINQLQTGTP